MATDSQNKDFFTYASRPETWIFAARKNIAVANVLFERVELLQKQQSRSLDEYSGCKAASLMHAGFAIENAAKAVLILRDPSIIEISGQLDKSKLGARGGHGLRDLVSKVIPELDNETQTLLLKLEEFTIWAGRYTVPNKATTLSDETMSVLRFSLSDEKERINSLMDQLLALHSPGQPMANPGDID